MLAGCGDDHQPQTLPPQNSSGSCVPSCSGHNPGGTGETGDGDDDFVCGERELTTQVGISRMLFVLDQSGSMGWAWDHDEDELTPDSTRWAVLHEVVTDIADGFAHEMDMGVLMFPSGHLDCSVAEDPEVPVEPDNADAILAFLPMPENAPQYGDTPTVSALRSARDHLAALPDDGPRAMVIVTDGAPTCGEGLDVAATVVAGAYDTHGIITYAVGLDVPDWALDGFEDVADAGGAPSSGLVSFYDIGNQEELEDAIGEIADQLQACTIVLDPEPEVPDKLEVRVDGEVVPKISDCDAGDGWVYTESQGPYDQILMCGSWCEKVQGGDVELIADYACPSVMPGP